MHQFFHVLQNFHDFSRQNLDSMTFQERSNILMTFQVLYDPCQYPITNLYSPALQATCDVLVEHWYPA